MSTTENSAIEQLIADYEQENCNFKDLRWVAEAAQIYAQRMEDSQLRCILHTLATAALKHIPEEKLKPPRVANANASELRPLVDQGLETAKAEISAIQGNHNVVIKMKSILRKKKFKSGGESAKLFIAVDLPWSVHGHDYRKIIHRHINSVVEACGHAKVLMSITTGSTTAFNARLYIEGDEEYERYKQYGFYNE